MRKLRALARAAMPNVLLRLYRLVRLLHSRRRDRQLPRQDVFTRIYREHEWGGAPGEYCSGAGSSTSHAEQYATIVRQFISDNGIASVVDVGCGDFTVGSQLQMPGVRYTGVDIVAGLIERNQERFGSDSTRFVCLDAVTDTLPDGELCLIRQVLQHLANDEIAAILRKLHKYRYAIITEHLPSPSRFSGRNKDKPHGPDTRVYDGSGVYVDQPPFSMKVVRVLFDSEPETPLVAAGEVIRTVLVEPRTTDERHPSTR